MGMRRLPEEQPELLGQEEATCERAAPSLLFRVLRGYCPSVRRLPSVPFLLFVPVSLWSYVLLTTVGPIQA